MRGDKLREQFKGANKSIVYLIYDVWRAPGCSDRAQVRTDYMKIEDAAEKYGDFTFDSWYTEGFKDGRTVAAVWVSAPLNKAIDPELYEKWK